METFKNVMMRIGAVIAAEALGVIGAGSLVGIEVWQAATLAGALGAQAMGDIRAFGLDSAVPAAFLGLVWPRLTGKFERILAVSCALFAIAMTPILPAGLPIIATAFIAIMIGLKR